MITFIGFILFVLCLSIHELGHAFAMRKNGVEMSEICLFGLTGPKLASFKIKRFFGETEITIRPLVPLGAFVRPVSDFSELPKNKQVDIAAAGIENNFYFGFALLAITSLTQGGFFAVLILTLATLLIFLLFRFAKAGFIIFLGLATIALTSYTIAKDVSSAGSVISIGKMIHGQADLYAVVTLGGAISISLGLMNAMPLFGLDGHRILNLYLPERFRRVTDPIAGIAMIALIILALGNDIISLF